jgi:hypothetical protein
MADVQRDIQAAVGEVYDTLRGDVFFDASDRIYLLKASETADEFTDVCEVTGQWFFEYSEFRQALTLTIAKSYDELTSAIDEATHIRIESGRDTDARSDYYRIRTGDTVPPLGVGLEWKLYCERFETQSGYSVIR